jgi:hypothetical protein
MAMACDSREADRAVAWMSQASWIIRASQITPVNECEGLEGFNTVSLHPTVSGVAQALPFVCTRTARAAAPTHPLNMRARPHRVKNAAWVLGKGGKTPSAA